MKDITQPLPAKRHHLFIDETGNEYNSWTVLGYAGKDKGRAVWLCRCGCGTESIVGGRQLRSNGSTQCRKCSQKEAAKKGTTVSVASGAWKESIKKAQAASLASGAPVRNVKKAQAASVASGASARNVKKATAASAIINTTHALSGNPQYQRWQNMNGRCHDPNNQAYDRYGGRGIQVCDDWRKTNPDGLKNFVEWFAKANKPITTRILNLHRTDNDGDYEPGNVEILTEAEHQKRHKKS